jgi:hypothetical protein
VKEGTCSFAMVNRYQAYPIGSGPSLRLLRVGSGPLLCHIDIDALRRSEAIARLIRAPYVTLRCEAPRVLQCG